jgi:hypothetical protein
MLTGYFDESYNKNFMVMCGWIASVEEWNNFEVDWKLFLISYKVPYFHMTEFAQSTGPFEKWKNTPNFRARFVHDAWEIVRERARKGFVWHVDEVLFNRIDRFYCLKEKLPSTYAFAGRECMRWVEDFGRKSGEQVRCVFHDGGPDKQGLLSTAGLVPKLHSPKFEPNRDIPDRKIGIRRGMVQLQSADFLAYEIGKYIKDHPLIRSGRQGARVSLGIFGQKRPDTMFFTEARLMTRCEELGIEKRQE